MGKGKVELLRKVGYIENSIRELENIKALKCKEYIRKTLPKNLKDFLVENNCLEPFINNHYNRFKHNITEFGHPNLNIDNAFTWDATPEGQDFWDDLHGLYCNL